MNLQQRSEIFPLLYRLQADLAVLKMRCAETQACQIGSGVISMKEICDDLVNDLKPEVPGQMTFPRSKY